MNSFSKTSLVYPPIDYKIPYFYSGASSPPYPPLGILSLAAFLRRQNFSLNPLILDGNLLDFEEIQYQLIKFKPEIIGFSPVWRSYDNTLKLSRLAKSWNAKVILGGHHAVGLAGEILQNRGPYSKDYCIDAVCREDGEEAFYEIISGKPFNEINNLIFQTQSGIKINPFKLLNLNDLPTALEMFNLINISSYYHLQKKYLTRNLIIYSRKGCTWRAKTGGCIFCSRMEKTFRLKDPDRFYEEFRDTAQNYKPDYIFDAGDSFLDDYFWLEKFSRHSFDDIGSTSLRIYARADQISESSVNLLKKIHVQRIDLGIESGDDQSLVALNKGCSSATNKRAVEVLAAAGIDILAYFILGAPGETIRSLKNTLEFAKSVKKRRSNFVTPLFLMPWPHSPARQLLIKKTGDKYKGKDSASNEELTRDWIKHFCRVDFQTMLGILREIRGLNLK